MRRGIGCSSAAELVLVMLVSIGRTEPAGFTHCKFSDKASTLEGVVQEVFELITK